MNRTHRKTRRGRALAATALVTALVGGVVATAMAGQDSPTSQAPASPALLKAAAPAERAAGLIVGYKSKSMEARSTKAVRDATKAMTAESGQKLSYKRRLGTGAVLMDLGGVRPAKDVAALMNRLRADPDVAYVVPDRRLPAIASQEVTDAPVADAAGDDTRTGDADLAAEQWNLSEAKAGMDVPDAWKTSTGKGVTVAVLDTGITQHFDLAANTVPGYDFISDSLSANDGDGRDGDATDPGDATKPGDCGSQSANPSSWHGTHVAGIVAAADNGKGTVGVAPGVQVQPVRVLGRCNTPNSDIIDALTWASGGSVAGVPDNKTPAQVVNMSLGLQGPCDAAMQNAVDAAVARGTTIVVAAGNRDTRPAPQDAGNFDWASCRNVITVAATDRDGNRAEYSNFGNVVDIAAPGGDMRQKAANGILSTFNAGTDKPGGENFKFEVGTSQAAPHIAGLAALVKAANPTLTPAEIETAIQTNARPLPGTCEGGCGAGLADAAKTVESVSKGAASPTSSPDPASAPASPSPSAGDGQAADGTDLGACFDNACEVEVTGGDTIQLDGKAGVDELRIDSVADNTLNFTGSSGNGAQRSSSSQTAPGQSTVNNLVVDLISIDGDRATVRLS
ncbi:S8 family peptidase [Streptomyces sp. NPDC001340]